MKRISLLLLLLINLSLSGLAQTDKDSTTAQAKEHKESSKVTVGGYVDTYFGYDFSRPSSKERPYFVSSNRHNEFTINLAFVDVKFTSTRVRATLRPAVGTYMEANYRAEPPIFRNLYEGNVGVKLFANKNIWVDAGVFGSPYTNESAMSKDQLIYTRSFAPEYVPYYLSGVKVSLPVSAKVSLYVYLLNGWQNIRENNDGKSVGTQLEYKPGTKWLINWNTYIGKERTEATPGNRTRYFGDVYVIYNAEGKFSATACVYIGVQGRVNIANGGKKEHVFWHNINTMGRYKFTPKISLSGRLEFFNDPDQVHIIPITPVNGFRTYSSSLCMNYSLTDQILMRMEGRVLFSDKEVYQNMAGAPTHTNGLFIASMAVSF